jgi:nicotinamidase/pyrazinamidase
MSVPLLFWDVDTQVDFMRAEGRLYVPGAESLAANLAALTEAARRHRLPVVASADDHEPGDAELSDRPDFRDTYPPHCLRGTAGAERIPETRRPEAVPIGHRPLSDGEIAARLAGDPPVVLLQKKRFDVFTNPNAERVVRALDPQRIVLYGVALDVCDRYAVEGLLARGYGNLELVEDAARPIHPEEVPALLADWRRRGVRMTTTARVLAELDAAGG